MDASGRPKLFQNFAKIVIDISITIYIVQTTSLVGGVSRDDPETEWGAVPVGCFVTSTPELYSSLWWGGVKKPRWSAGRRSVFSPENTRTSSPEGVADALARRPPAPPTMVRARSHLR